MMLPSPDRRPRSARAPQLSLLLLFAVACGGADLDVARGHLRRGDLAKAEAALGEAQGRSADELRRRIAESHEARRAVSEELERLAALGPSEEREGLAQLLEGLADPVLVERVELAVSKAADRAAEVAGQDRRSLKQTTEDPWIHAEDRYHVGDRVSGKVVSLTDYGAFVELEEGIEGLIHISEMSWTKRVKHPSRMVAIGDTVEAIVLDIDSKNKRISLGMKQIEPNPWTLLHERYPVGTRILGKIRNITDFGIFIGIEEGIDGLVHISDLSWTHKVKHPSELFKKGDEVEAVVLNIDVENERFSLGIKQLTPDAWEEEIPNKYTIGRAVQGKITKVHDFSAFMELEPGVEGLIHISELSTERVENASDVVNEGQDVIAEIISVDREERKIGLSLKALAGENAPEMRSYIERQGKATTSLGEVFGAQLSHLKPEDDD